VIRVTFIADFIAYHYFLRVVPTTYVAPRSKPLHTNQYSVTHYERQVSHQGVPGIFFKFDIEPVRLTVIQRTTTLGQFFIRYALCLAHRLLGPDSCTNRWAGVVGGVFVCASWALRATNRVITVVAGPDDTDSIAPMPDSARSGGLRGKWTGAALRPRPSNASLRPTIWGDSGAGSPYSSTYSGSSFANSPVGSPMPYSPYSPVVPPPPLSGRTPSPSGVFPGSSSGLGLSPSLFSPSLPSTGRTPATLNPPAPGHATTAYGHFPPTPRSPLSGFAGLPQLRDEKKDN
jgi:endoplasmic reticulum-Golgi intermediate compartment protein 2